MVAFDSSAIYWSWKQTQNKGKQCLIDLTSQADYLSWNCDIPNLSVKVKAAFIQENRLELHKNKEKQ